LIFGISRCCGNFTAAKLGSSTFGGGYGVDGSWWAAGADSSRASSVGIGGGRLFGKQIASQIGIAPRTVEGHIENVRLKMRARNKTHVVTQALQSGVLKLGIASA
jgi:hypothetical protein